MKKKYDAVQFQREMRRELGKHYLKDRKKFIRDLENQYAHLKRQKAFA